MATPDTPLLPEKRPDEIPGLPREASPGERLAAAYAAKLKPATRAAYDRELRLLTQWAGFKALPQLLDALIRNGQGWANQLAMQWVAHLRTKETRPKGQRAKRGMASASINRSLSALRSLVRVARKLDVGVSWTIDVDSEPRKKLDHSGPTVEELAKIMAAAKAQEPEKAARDVAIMHLLLRALRCFEISGLDLEHWDSRGVMALRKRRQERLFVELNMSARNALSAWVAVRGPEPGPLFWRLDGKRQRLAPAALWRLFKRWAVVAGLESSHRLRPHGVRHRAITEVLNRNNGDVRMAKWFSGHDDIRVLMDYDDARQELGQKATDLLDGLL